MVLIEKKWIEAEKATFVESVNEKTGDKEFYIDTKIFPYEKKSRNGVRYNKESALSTKDQIVGISLNHNHVTNGENNFPRGEWTESYDGGDGLYGKAKVYNTSYNKEYIEWLKTADNIRVSLQVSGDAESKKDESDGSWYREAQIKDWLEISTVNVPGFFDAKAKFESVMCEMVNLGESENMEGALFEELQEALSVLKFSDEDTTEDAAKILKQNNVKHLPNLRKAVIVFDDDEERGKAKALLMKAGMNGISRQSVDEGDFFEQLSSIQSKQKQ